MPRLSILWLPLLSVLVAVPAQEPQKPPEPEKTPPPQVLITLLETSVRFETNGDSRKEVHCIVKINSEVGARQFAQLNFDYNRGFQQVEIPLVRVTHSSGGTADILPSAVADNPNPAVVNYPAYHDVRVKSVRILGLAPSDTLEYRVITTTTHHPLAPDFWLDHTFDRSGLVSHELFTLDLPGTDYFDSKFPPGCSLEWMVGGPSSRTRVCGTIPYTSSSDSCDQRPISRCALHWDLHMTSANAPKEGEVPIPDVIASTFDGGFSLVERLAAAFTIKPEDLDKWRLDWKSVVPTSGSSTATIQDAYDFVSRKLVTVDLPVGATGFRLRAAKDILDSGFATTEEKCALLLGFARSLGSVSPSARAKSKQAIDAQIVFPTPHRVSEEPVRPSMLEQPLVVISDRKKQFALDPGLEVAPFALIPPSLRGKPALTLIFFDAGDYLVPHWIELPVALPFAAIQRVSIDAWLTLDGALSAKVHYSMRGDNELLLRVAFHQSPREKWNEVALLLSLADGFRGKVGNVSASDPYATKDPFTVEYEISQPKFVDWSKKPVRIPAILPLVGLPDPPADAKSPIELGTPLEVQTSVTLHLPPGTVVESPAGTTVDRNYATFSSQYSATGNTITASRRIHFIARQVSASRNADYNAFLRAIQNDQSQLFRLTRAD